MHKPFDSLFTRLKTLDALVPEGEGAVSLMIYSDGTWLMTLEMWGVKVAECKDGKCFYLDEMAVNANNPEWIPDLRALVEKLNAELTDCALA